MKVGIKNQIYVITGGPGFGKSTLINYLEQLGYSVGHEVAREIIREQRSKGGNVLPDKDICSFQQEVLKRRLAFYNSVEKDEVVFSDRAIPDQIAFARYRGFDTPDILIDNAWKVRYNEMVFITPPWQEIYKNDMVRSESFEKACELHQIIFNVYREFDYLPVEIPCLGIKQRVDFILNLINKKNGF